MNVYITEGSLNFRQYGQMKRRDGKSKRREEKKKEDQRRDNQKRREDERGSKKRPSEERRSRCAKKSESRETLCFFHWFVAPEGRKVSSLKRISKPKCTKHTFSDHCCKLRCRKSARPCGTKHISKSTYIKHNILRPLLEVDMSKKCASLWREAHFKVKSVKNWWSRSTFGSWHVEKVHAVVARSTFRRQKCKKLKGYGALLDVRMSFCVAGTRGSAPCQKWASREGFVAVSKTMEGVGHLKRIWRDAFRAAGASLAELLRFWRCQVQKLRKSRRIASFSSLQIDR